MAETEIKPCTCEHKSQDKLYGKGRRVFNLGLKGATCTVCGKTSGKSTKK